MSPASIAAAAIRHPALKADDASHPMQMPWDRSERALIDKMAPPFRDPDFRKKRRDRARENK